METYALSEQRIFCLVQAMSRCLVRIQSRLLAIVLGCALVLTVVPVVQHTPAAANTAPFCRSTTGNGTVLETDKLKNGYYEANGIRIEPVFSRRLYIDPTRDFDAAYIGYRVSNRSTTARELWIEVVDLTNPAAPVELVDRVEQIQRIGRITGTTGSGNSLVIQPAISRFFLIRANATTNAATWHTVRIFDGQPGTTGATQLATCQSNIDGVQRSLSANANKVTAITVTGTPAIGETLTVTVVGTPGTVGQGNATDGAVMALTPATSRRWPARSLRLETVGVSIGGLKQAVLSACAASDVNGTVTTGGSGSNRTSNYTGGLVLRNMDKCVAKGAKPVYTATYVFRVLAPAATAPVIRPYASIASGTQVKYTGSLPSTDVSLPIDEDSVAVALTAKKSFVSAAKVANTHVDVLYRVRVARPDDAVARATITLHAIEDLINVDGVLQSATVKDAVRTTAVAVPIGDVVTSEAGTFPVVRRFPGLFTVSDAHPVMLEYTIRLPLPAAPTTTTVTNYAYALSGQYVIGSGPNVTGIVLTVSDDSDDGVVTDDEVDKPNLQTQQIAFTQPVPMGVGASITLTAVTDSGLPVYYEAGSAEVCTAREFDGAWTLTALAEGDCVVTANALGNSTYAAATEVARTITVLPGQFITSPGATLGTAPNVDVTFTATSKLQVAVESLDTDVCSVTGIPKSFDAQTGDTVFTVTNGSANGSCLLVATQPGDGATWGPAPAFELTLGVGEAQILSFSAPTAGQTYTLVRNGANTAWVSQSVSLTGTTTVNSSLAGEARLPLFYTSLTSSVCRLESLPLNADGEATTGLNTGDGVTTQTLTFVDVGTCTVAADQDGTNNSGDPSVYASASRITRSFTVLTDASTLQYLFISTTDTKTYGAASFTVTASSRKTDSVTGDLTLLLVALTGTNGVCVVATPTITGGITSAQVNLVGAGTCVLTASQAGNESYRAAALETANFTVNPKVVQLSGVTAPTRVYDGTTATTITGTPSLTGIVPGDTPTQVAPSGSITGTFGSAAAGVNKTVTLTGAVLTGTKQDSYTLGSPATATATITPRPVPVDGLTAPTRVYDGTTNAPISGTPTLRAANDSASGQGVVSGDDVALSGTATGQATSADVGSRAVTLSGLSLVGNNRQSYAFVEPDLTLVITMRPLTLTATSQSVNQGQAATCQVLASNLAATDVFALQACTYRDAGNSERNAVPGEPAGATYTITPATYTLKRGEVDAAANYTVTLVTGTLTIDSRITPTVTAASATSTLVYGTTLGSRLDTTAVDATNGNAAVPGTFAHRCDGASVTDTTVKPVGVYDIVTTFTPTDTVVFSTATVTRRITVTRRPVNLLGVADTHTFVYSGDTSYLLGGTLSTQTDPGNAAEGVLATGTVVAVTGTARLSRTDNSANITADETPAAATVTGVSLTGAKSENYELVLPTGVTVTVTPRPITITAAAQTIAPDETPACTIGSVSVTVGSFAAGESLGTVTCAVQNDNGTTPDSLQDGSSYLLAVTDVTLSPDRKANYTITYVRGVLTVAKYDLEIAADMTVIMYGEIFTTGLAAVKARRNGQDIAGAFAFRRGGDTVDGTERLTVGDATVSITFTPTNGNRFKDASDTKMVRVNPRPLAVTPRNQFRLLSDPDPQLAVDVAPLLAGDTADGFGTFTRTSARPTTIGNHPLVVAGGTAPANYTFTYTQATLIVADVVINVTESGGFLTSNEVTCNCEGLVPGMNLTLTINSTPLQLATDVAADDGTCPFLAGTVPDDFDDGNHTLVVAIQDGEEQDLLNGQTVELSRAVVMGS